MGKEEQPDLRPGGDGSRPGSASLFASDDVYPAASSSLILYCNRCSARVSRELSFKCVVILALSLFLLVSGIFLILHPSVHKPSTKYYYDASDEIKLNATVHASFRLQKSVADLLPEIGRLEYDIFSEIGLPDSKIVILSMHPADVANCSDVVFGVLSDPLYIPISEVSLSVLRSSMVELFLMESNLTLTNSSFGHPSSFEILKFPGGVTVIPDPYSIIQLPRVFFNFTINNSIVEILDNLLEFKFELKLGLLLKPFEALFVNITNSNGSTITTPVVVQASVVSNFGNLLPQRLKQLADTIRKSPEKNLGLDHSRFGKVKSVILSSYLQGIDANAPVSLPAPSPHYGAYAEPPLYQSPSPMPDLAPIPSHSSSSHHTREYYKGHHQSLAPARSPHHGAQVTHSPCPPPYNEHGISPSPSRPKQSPQSRRSQPRSMAPLPGVSYGSRPERGSFSSPITASPEPSSSTVLLLRSGRWEIVRCFLAVIFVNIVWCWK